MWFNHTQLFGKIYHWTYTVKKKRPVLTLHQGDQENCRRVHRDKMGAKA